MHGHLGGNVGDLIATYATPPRVCTQPLPPTHPPTHQKTWECGHHTRHDQEHVGMCVAMLLHMKSWLLHRTGSRRGTRPPPPCTPPQMSVCMQRAEQTPTPPDTSHTACPGNTGVLLGTRKMAGGLLAVLRSALAVPHTRPVMVQVCCCCCCSTRPPGATVCGTRGHCQGHMASMWHQRTLVQRHMAKSWSAKSTKPRASTCA
jgi:hypothetical protein